MSASQAAGESSSSSAPQEPEPPQRRWVALVSKPRILPDAEDERARAMVPSLVPRDPPTPSYLDLQPRAGFFGNQRSAYILAADRSGRLLFRVTKPTRNPGVNEPAEREVMYVFNTHSRKSRRLPAVPYSNLRIQAQPRRSVGLIADTRPYHRGNYLVVQLCPRPPDSAILADKILCYDIWRKEWFVKQLHTTTEVRDRNLRGEAGVVAHAGRLYWLALGYGVFVCDPFAEPSRLRFVKLPDGCMMLEVPEDAAEVLKENARVYAAARRRVAPSEGRLRFVDVQGLSYDRDDEAPPPVKERSVRMWTLIEPEGEEPWWRHEYEVHFADVWAQESYTTAGLPHGEVPRVAFVDPDDHRVIYFLNIQGSRLFSLNERTKRVVSWEVPDCSSVRDDREIMFRNSRPIIDAWEQSAPTPTPSPPGGRRRQTQGNLEFLKSYVAQEIPRLVRGFSRYAGQSYYF